MPPWRYLWSEWWDTVNCVSTTKYLLVSSCFPFLLFTPVQTSTFFTWLESRLQHQPETGCFLLLKWPQRLCPISSIPGCQESLFCSSHWETMMCFCIRRPKWFWKLVLGRQIQKSPRFYWLLVKGSQAPGRTRRRGSHGLRMNMGTTYSPVETYTQDICSNTFQGIWFPWARKIGDFLSHRMFLFLSFFHFWPLILFQPY